MKHYSVLWESTANMCQYFLPMYSVAVYPDHLTNFQNEKTPMLAVLSPFRGLKATFLIKKVCGKRQHKAEKDKNIYLFLETGKSAGCPIT